MVLPFGLDADGHHVLGAGDGSNEGLLAGSGGGGGGARSMDSKPLPSAPPMSHYMGQMHANVSTGVPVIPSTHIDFIVVNGDDRCMIRCERKAVLEKSVELAKLIHAGPNSGRRRDNHFQIANVDKNDFELLIRFLENGFVKCRDHEHLLAILELANRFNCPDLTIHCIRELDLHLSSKTVIPIYRTVRYYHAPPNAAIVNYPQPNAKNTTVVANAKPFTTEEYAVALLNNALQLIDMHAELVLSEKEVTQLRFEELEIIAKRDTLQLSSELVLFTCLADWSAAECTRKKLDCTAENRRRVLGGLCYTPHYLRMTASEFRKACERVELLDSAEISLVADAIEGKKLKNLSDEQNQMLEKFRTPRPEYAKMPIHLSDRSNPKNYPKKMRRADSGANDQGCCYNFGMNCLTVFACIFD